ncbi:MULTISPECIES: carbohydrate ABC transporter permease [unclassified Chelatococcus]|uniref:carbohydrate ABC transporter permease n=1 Tax=unclassified Chelatococcus TaxID=2638111 RepID=UPI001BCF84F1|nr:MULTISPECIES: carbohydrate ABC transporter permease [unclassified Chelatococcus]CAH1658035.1 Carbohydrate ABC transporter permease [Hyphomicrobiales bacterium]MBS7742226.1 carbohydrate ABC transporter permease [Chelatococcus sp. HY11]MBX3542656.1 carbohydrate ABC transporter permease [Chelatococcus sp.]MCO5075128.1 carbohydrate ABC transporter permease [Chelatococcus sp.]CAH1689533.1 Carbohydrate ABC transporter permease [Hyphomicrobiales bacterium]
MMKLSRPWAATGQIILFITGLSIAIPLLLVLGTSFKPANEIYAGYPWPLNPTFENYREVFDKLPFGAYLLNSAATTALRVTGQLIIALLAAYAFARYRFRGRAFVFALVLGAMMIPHQLTFLPVYLLVNKLGWFDSWAALIVPNLAMPLAVFLLRQHLLSFPRELYDAASMDGAGELRTLWSIVLPNIKPVMAALTIVLFVDCWNEYFWPLVVTETENAMTAQIGVRRFLDAERGDDLGPLMAAVTLISLPAVAVFVLFQRQIINTFVSVGIKG